MGNFTLELFLLLLNILIVYLFILEKRKHKKLTDKLQSLYKTVNEERSELKKLSTKNLFENKRQAFRVEIPSTKINFQIIDTDSTLLSLLNKKGQGEIVDISYTGMKFICDFDLPIRNNIILNLEFILGSETFFINGKLLRKEGHQNNKYIIYGVKFSKLTYSDEKRLMKVISQLELHKKKM